MNKPLKFNILIVVSVFVFFFSCKQSSDKDLKKANTYPSEWMYNQRAYPNNYFNKKAIKKGIRQIKELKANKSSNSTNWELKGPINIGGRITDIAISPVNNNHFYISTAVGGVFKTTDKGLNWTPIFDNIGRPSIGNIEIAPSNANRIYVGTGEANGSATSGAFFGDGIYRSDDAGNNWTHIGLEDSNHIGRIVVDPNNQDRLFVATTGVLYGKNVERGLYRSINAGTTWEKVLYVSDSTAVIDVVMNPVNTNILFAATWERTRRPWQRDYAGETTGVYRSLDGGDSWIKLTNGLPVDSEENGRIGLTISPSNPNVIYASYTTNHITNTFNGLYKTTNNGDTWSLVALNDISNVNSSFGWYFGNIRVHPTNENEVYVLGQLLYKTTNGGTNWNQIFGMHVDHHSMEYSKSNPNFMLSGNDGGLYISEDAGANWSHFENLPITQFYNIEVDELQPQRLFGGAQDNNTLRTVTGNNNDWNSILGGDGFQVNVDKNNSNNVYAESQFGNLFRSIDGGNTMLNGLNGIDGNDRNNWNTPVEISPFNTNVLYYGSNKLYQSVDKAESWTVISDDLTNGMHPSGATSYGTLTCIAPSYQNLDVVYTGSDDGNISVTFDSGVTWESIDDGLPNAYVTQIAIHPTDDLTAYATFSGFGVLDYSPHVFKTIDGGQNWEDISSNLPSIPVNDIVIDNTNNLLYIATDAAVWVSNNEGVSWGILGNDLPITIIADIKLHKPTNTLYAGTFGRSMFSIDVSEITVSINDVSTDDNFKVYPNPIKDDFNLNVQFKNATQIKVFLSNINGKTSKIIFSGIVEENQILSLQKPNLEAGVYFLHIVSENKHLVKKVMLK